MDLVGPLELDANGYKYVITIQCELSQFLETYSFANNEAGTIPHSFATNFILRYGIPDKIVTDKGTEFMSSVFSGFCTFLGIKHLNSSAYHHETLGAWENYHKHLGAYLAKQCAKYKVVGVVGYLFEVFHTILRCARKLNILLT